MDPYIPPPNFGDPLPPPGIKPLAPLQTDNIWSGEHLIQTQHKGSHIDIVDHIDKIHPDAGHIITRVDRDGNIDINFD